MYGFVAKKIDADNRFDCGLTYLISNDIIIDLSGGFGISKISPKNYLSLGFSYRFKTTKK